MSERTAEQQTYNPNAQHHPDSQHHLDSQQHIDYQQHVDHHHNDNNDVQGLQYFHI